jgi:hypothetical protein
MPLDLDINAVAPKEVDQLLHALLDIPGSGRRGGRSVLATTNFPF